MDKTETEMQRRLVPPCAVPAGGCPENTVSKMDFTLRLLTSDGVFLRGIILFPGRKRGAGSSRRAAVPSLLASQGERWESPAPTAGNVSQKARGHWKAT